MVATGTVVLSYLGYVFPSTIGAASVQVQGLIIIAFIVLSAVLANQRFRLTQNIVNVVCVLYALAIGLVVLAGIVHLAAGRHRGDRTPLTGRRGRRRLTPVSTSPIGASSAWWCSRSSASRCRSTWASRSRTSGRYALPRVGSLAVMLAYLLATWAVMVTVPAATASRRR